MHNSFLSSFIIKLNNSRRTIVYDKYKKQNAFYSLLHILSQFTYRAQFIHSFMHPYLSLSLSLLLPKIERNTMNKKRNLI